MSNRDLIMQSCIIRFMKTVIIKIEPGDDYLSIKNKITTSNSRRILLVIPRNVRKFPTDRDLVMLNRSAQTHGAQFAIVTRQFNRREFAERIGINVFQSVSQAERENWGTTQHKNKFHDRAGLGSLLEERKNLPTTRKNHAHVRVSKPFLWGGLGFIALIFLIVFLPSARVIVYPASRNQELTMQVSAVVGRDQPSLTGVIPAVKETITVSGEKTAISTGNVEIGIQRASGEVEVQNLSQQSFVLPTGSIFSTGGKNPIRFTSLREVEIPADEMLVSIPVEALEAGVDGNIQSGAIILLEGVNGSSLLVTNQNAFTGGSSESFPAPEEEDYNHLYGNLINDLREKASQEIYYSGDKDYVPIPASLHLDEIIDEKRYQPIAEASDTLKMAITARFSVLFYDPEDLNKLVNDLMDISLDEGFIADRDGIMIQEIGQIEVISDDEVAWIVDARRLIYREFSPVEIKKMIRGKSIEQAENLIDAKISHQKKSEIIPFVDWWPYIPVLIARIELEERLTNDG